MKRRIAIWASVGFVIACCWVVYTFVTPAENLGAALREPLVQAALFTSCPVAIAGRYVPLAFWWIPPINAATYALIALIVGVLTRKRLGLVR